MVVDFASSSNLLFTYLKHSIIITYTRGVHALNQITRSTIFNVSLIHRTPSLYISSFLSEYIPSHASYRCIRIIIGDFNIAVIL